MLADGGAREIDAVALAGDADQSEVAGAAADVAHQDRLPVEQALLRTREIVGDPGIKRRGGFFEQRQLLDSRFARGRHRELARFFVEAGGDGEHHVVHRRSASRRSFANASARCFTISRGHFHGRQNAAAFLRVPGQNFRGAVDFRIRKPALRRMDALGGHQRALLARVDADVFLIAQDTGTTAACGAASMRPGATYCGTSRTRMAGKSVSAASCGSM